MEYSNRLQQVSVLGAAGKMGSGILLLAATELADLSLKPENKDKTFVLNAIDISDAGLHGLMNYIRTQVVKQAEKKTVMLRSVYAGRNDLIENAEIINQYVNDVMNLIRPTTKLEVAYQSKLIFEAAVENPELKIKLLKQINENNTNAPWFFTNTSSIPIGMLDEKAGLDGRILGVHFYNPPAVQKLVEVIKGKNTHQELFDFALQLIKNLRKKAVQSNDFAGFIGNGHFMRDALHGISEANNLAGEISLPQAIYIINKVSQDFLVRPMGIFQLIDYVGIEVCAYIMSVMNPYLPGEDLHSDLLDKMVAKGVLGGQYSSGAQKDGFLQYDRGRITGIYDLDKGEYIAIEEIATDGDSFLGALPASFKPWKSVNFSRNKADLLSTFFGDLNSMETQGAKLAKTYMKKSREIALKLVADKVALSNEDVNTVMLTGFYHAYGPINDYLN